VDCRTHSYFVNAGDTFFSDKEKTVMQTLHKHRIIFAFITLAVVVMLIISSVFYLRASKSTTEIYMLQNSQLMISPCTMDVPSSHCGDGKDTLHDTNGNAQALTLQGYDDQKGRERYDSIKNVLLQSLEEHKQVSITSKNGVITQAVIVE
jgi:hypothetical protein